MLSKNKSQFLVCSKGLSKFERVWVVRHSPPTTMALRVPPSTPQDYRRQSEDLILGRVAVIRCHGNMVVVGRSLVEEKQCRSCRNSPRLTTLESPCASPDATIRNQVQHAFFPPSAPVPMCLLALKDDPLRD